MSGIMERDAVGRKKSGKSYRTVRIEAPIVARAEMVARDMGIPVNAYLSDLLRAPVEKGWLKLVKRANEAGDGEPAE